MQVLQTDRPPYEYVISAAAAPAGFANGVDVEDRIVQMVDEFQNLNMYIDTGVEDKPCRAHMSTAEMRTAPLLVTGSLIGVVSEELMLWLPMRFWTNIVPKMKAEEARAMTLNYGRLYGHTITPDLATYIVYVTNGVPGRILELLLPKMGKPWLASRDDVDRALEFEVDIEGTIKKDWDVPDFTAKLNYHLESGEELDIVLESEQVVIMIECKHYAQDRLDQLTPSMVDDFVAKATRLHQTNFVEKELRLGFFSKHGVEPTLRDYLAARHIWLTPGEEP